MDWQTFLNIGLALLAGYLGVQNYQINQRKDTRRESEEMAEIRVQLNNVMSLLQDLQRDVKATSKDYRDLLERVAIIEAKLNTAFERIDELKKEH